MLYENEGCNLQKKTLFPAMGNETVKTFVLLKPSLTEFIS